jgi:hypothetical protein
VLLLVLLANTNAYSANTTAKTLIQFQTKSGANGLYYYSIYLDKYYITGQTINGNTYKIHDIHGSECGRDQQLFGQDSNSPEIGC